MTNSDDSRFLTVLAHVSRNDDVELFPGFVTSAGHRVFTDPESPYEVELSGRDGEVLERRRLPAQELCGDGRSTEGIALMAKVPLLGGTAQMRILREGRTLLERNVSAEPPEIRLTWRPPDRPGKRELVTWEAEHPEGRPLHYIVVYNHRGDESWQPVSLVTPSTSHEVGLEHLPGGSACRLAVLCSDGFNTIQATSAPFALPLRPCQAFISAPLDGDRVQAGEPVVMRGQGYWLEEDRPEYEELQWWSSLEGTIGRGATSNVALRPGVHEITLGAGHNDRASTTSVTIEVIDATGEPHPA